MKREIKFRCWTGTHMIFQDQFDNINFCDGGANPFRIWTKDEQYILLDYRTTLMQFTGLKDKNGVDIYEGDVVEDKGVIFSDEVRNLTVEFRQDEAGFAFKEIPNSAFLGVYAKRCEVIGNVHQHPNFLPS